MSALEETHRLSAYVLHLLSTDGKQEFKQLFDQVMNEFANSIIKMTAMDHPVKHSSIMMVDQDEQVLRIVGSNGLPVGSGRRTFRKGKCFAGDIWETGRASVCDDVLQDRRFQDLECRPSATYRGILGVPVIGIDEDVMGAMFVQSRDAKAFAPKRDVAVVSYLAQLLAICFSEHRRRTDAETSPGRRVGQFT